jgi:molybdopterin-containing oxidoreductase family membrane subunit
MYDMGDYIFTFGLFFTLYLGFAKYFPVINMFEVKTIIKGETHVREGKKDYSGSQVLQS